jgi:hypothetical protein
LTKPAVRWFAAAAVLALVSTPGAQAQDAAKILKAMADYVSGQRIGFGF